MLSAFQEARRLVVFPLKECFGTQKEISVHDRMLQKARVDLEISKALPILCGFWLVVHNVQTVLTIGQQDRVETAADERRNLGQLGLLPVLWLVATALSIFLRFHEHCRNWCDVELSAVCIVAALGAVLPHMDEELHSFEAEDIMAATFKPLTLLMSATTLPARRSRFMIVVVAYAASFLMRYGLTESEPYLADAAVVLTASFIVCWSRSQQDRLLLECITVEKRLEESASKMAQQERDTECQKQVMHALRSLLRQHTDAVLTLTDRLTIAQSSQSLDFFFLQEMEGRPLVSAIPAFEHQQILDAFREVHTHRRAVAVCATLPRGPARLIIDAAGNEKPQFLVAVKLQDRNGMGSPGEAAGVVEEGEKMRGIMPVAPNPIGAASEESRMDRKMISTLLAGGTLKVTDMEGGHSLMGALPKAQQAQQAQQLSIWMDPLVHSSYNRTSSNGSARSSLQSRRDKDTWKFADELLSVSLTATDVLSMSISGERLNNKKEQEVQVNIDVSEPGITQSVQTEFTWSEDGMTCYHCLMARPPRPASADGRGSVCRTSSGGSKRVRRNSSRVSLRNADDAKLAAVWSGNLPHPVRMLPQFDKTGPKFVVRSLALLMNQWNLEYPGGVCCKYHAVASLVVFLLRSELSQKCKPAWNPNSAWQCGTCGFMHTKDDFACNMCGSGRDSSQDARQQGLDETWSDVEGGRRGAQALKPDKCMAL